MASTGLDGRCGDARRPHDLLGDGLVHGDGAGPRPGQGVGNVEDVEQGAISIADEAKARIKALTQEDTAAVVAAAEAEEAKVVGNGVLRLLVENRLAAAGEDPGTIDGRFDKTTRRAIRRFQRDQGLTVTGYVTQATMVRLLAVP